MPSETIGSILKQHAATFPTKPFVRCGTEVLTFHEMDRRATHVAANLHRIGVSPGDRVATILPNRAEVFDLYFGCALLGAVQVPLNVFLKGEFLRYQLADSQAAVLVVDRAGWESALPIISLLPDLHSVVFVDDEVPTALPAGLKGYTTAELRTPRDEPSVPGPGPTDTLSILYTSGTTGPPKGCVLSHAYCLFIGGLMFKDMGQRHDDVLITGMPAYHGLTHVMVVGAALVGGSTVVIDPGFRAADFLPRAAEVGATLAYGVGVTGAALLRMPPGPADRAHPLRRMMIIPFGAAEQSEFAERFGIDPFAEFYGQTECIGITTNDADGARHRSCMGYARSDLMVSLLDDDGRPVATGEVGEVAIRPREPGTMFDGYWNKPSETLEAYRGLWFHTGDLARQDEDGAFYFVDRKKDALRRRGENISSHELETALAQHPSVREVAVVGIAVGSSEDEVKAVIVPEGDTPEVEELFDFWRSRIPYYTMPRFIEFVPELPRNATERVMKYKLRQEHDPARCLDLGEMGLTIAREERR